MYRNENPISCFLEFLVSLSRVLYEKDDEPAINPDVIYNMDDIENYPTMEKIQKSQSECPELKKVIDCLNKGKEIEAGPTIQAIH